MLVYIQNGKFSKDLVGHDEDEIKSNKSQSVEYQSETYHIEEVLSLPLKKNNKVV